MAIDNITYARPYAKAAFEFALAQQQLPKWSLMLEAIAQICVDKETRRLFGDPLVSSQRLGELFIEVCGQVLDEHGQEFVRLLAYNRRLSLAVEIKQLYDVLHAEYEKSITVEVVSFKPLSSAQQAALTAALKQRLQRDIILQNQIDEQLLGGAVIRAKDLVIDGSVRGQLEKLYRQIV